MEKILKLGKKAILPVLASLCLTACIRITRLPLDVEQRKTINQSNEILTSSQKELQVEDLQPKFYYPAAPGIVGLFVGAGISLAITNNEDIRVYKATDPLRKNLADYHFNDLMNQHLTKELSSIKWLRLNKKQVMDELSYTQKRILTNNRNKIGDVLIYVDLSYKLSKLSLDTMVITTEVDIYKKENPKAVLIYHNMFRYIDRLEPQKTMQDYIRTWSENHAARARQCMNSAIQLLSKAIVKDILDPGIKPNKKLPTNYWYSEGQYTNGIPAARLEEKIDNKYVLRTNLGHIVIADERSVTRKHNFRE